MNNSKSISVLFGLIVGIISLLTAVLLGEVDSVKLLSAGIISTFSSTLLFAIITENLFDKKINQIYKSFERIRNKEYERVEVDKSFIREINPLKGINDEIYNFANLKQLEIDELKRLEAFRKDFLQDVSHELKTPIFAAQGFVHTLLDNIDADEEIRKNFLEKAAKSLDYLDMLVKDLLTISQMESGTLHKIFPLPSKGAPETDQGLDRTVVRQVVNTKPLRPFFNITFYIKGIYRCIKINFT